MPQKNDQSASKVPDNCFEGASETTEKCRKIGTDFESTAHNSQITKAEFSRSERWRNASSLSLSYDWADFASTARTAIRDSRSSSGGCRAIPCTLHISAPNL